MKILSLALFILLDNLKSCLICEKKYKIINMIAE